MSEASPSNVGSRRRRARRGEGERLRDDILRAAGALLAETRDEHAVSIRAVADAVGVTPPSIYLHFADKTQLLLAVCQMQFERFNASLEQATSGVTDPVEELRLMGQAYVRFGLENPEHYRIMFMAREQLHPESSEQAILERATGFRRLVDTVRRCMEVGAFERGDPFLVATYLWSNAHGLTSLRIARPDFPWPPLDTALKQMFSVSARGLQRRRSRAARRD